MMALFLQVNDKSKRKKIEEERISCLVKVLGLDLVTWAEAVYINVNYFSSSSV